MCAIPYFDDFIFLEAHQVHDCKPTLFGFEHDVRMYRDHIAVFKDVFDGDLRVREHGMRRPCTFFVRYESGGRVCVMMFPRHIHIGRIRLIDLPFGEEFEELYSALFVIHDARYGREVL